MNYLIYKITNTVNNKIYIGCHKTDNVDDGYMGSGKVLKRAIEKYGIYTFSKEILHNFDNSEDMFSMESELVNEDFVKDQSNYNIKEGGSGGWDYVRNHPDYKAWQTEGATNGGKTRHISKEEWSASISTGLMNSDKRFNGSIAVKEKYPYGPFKGGHHNQASKDAIGKANSIKQKGSGNSQHGTMWVTNDKENKKIKKDQPIPEGFRKGRNMSHINYKKNV